jgi:hypothetical protein
LNDEFWFAAKMHKRRKRRNRLKDRCSMGLHPAGEQEGSSLAEVQAVNIYAPFVPFCGHKNSGINVLTTA